MKTYLLSLMVLCLCAAAALAQEQPAADRQANFSAAKDLRLLSVGVRARVTESTVLGKAQPESFQEYDAVVHIRLPWEAYSVSGWGVGTRLMGSAGVLRGAGETALVASLIPMLAFGSQDGRFSLDMGAGGALLSRDRFGSQDFGGPFQFALTLGAGVPLYQRLGVGYRFVHYSDAALHGSDTIGADFHMVEFTYRFSD